MINQDLKKINSLLNFYNKEEVNISLKIKSINNLVVRGLILKKSLINPKYIILKGNEKAPIKIFLEDILPDSIIPLDYEKKENKNGGRTNLPKSLRHKILKRDRYTCQACGARAPDVELEVDHKVPISKGGTDDELNLITLCRDCNRGKSDRV